MGYSVSKKKMAVVLLQVLMLLVSQIVVVPAAAANGHIFLSFRGADTRDTLASLVYDALIREGFHVFMDDESIRTGQDIDMIIAEAINSSNGAVIIFSKGFPSSEWCLEELIGILGRKKEMGNLYVLAVLYVDGLQPDDVYDHSGGYGEALAKHKSKCSFWDSNCKKKIEEWRSALKQVTSYRGWVLTGKWANFINGVVREIRQEWNILGLEIMTVNPHRRPYPIEMYELVTQMLIVGKFIYHNWQLVTVIMLSGKFRRSLLDHVCLLLMEG